MKLKITILSLILVWAIFGVYLSNYRSDTVSEEANSNNSVPGAAARLTRTFWYGDCDLMQEIASALTEAGVSVTIMADRSIKYDADYRVPVEKIANPIVLSYNKTQRKDKNFSCRPDAQLK